MTSTFNRKGPKIKELHITPIAVIDPPLLNAAGLHAPYALRTVVELVTEDNISGISEIPGNSAIDMALAKSQVFDYRAGPFSVEPNQGFADGAFWYRQDIRKRRCPLGSANIGAYF